MMTSVLIYNTGRYESKLMTDVYARLRSEKFIFKIISRDTNPYRNARPWLAAGSVVWLTLPFWYGLYMCVFMMRSLFSKTRIVVCFHWPEKIIISVAARLFRWRVIWLELPDARKPHGWMMKKIYHRLARRVEIIVFSQEKMITWKKIIGDKGVIYTLKPALYPPESIRQIDLFQKLAERPHSRFVISAFIEHLDRRLIERLLSGLTSALSVCSNLELLIMGEGENRKKLLWLIRKMGLGNHVWLAGQTDDITRHLDHIDIYVIPAEHPSLEEIGSAIMVLHHGIPIIAQVGSGVEAIINPTLGAVVDIADSEALGAEFLRFEQLGNTKNKVMRSIREQSAGYTVEALATDFKKILEISVSYPH